MKILIRILLFVIIVFGIFFLAFYDHPDPNNPINNPNIVIPIWLALLALAILYNVIQWKRGRSKIRVPPPYLAIYKWIQSKTDRPNDPTDQSNSD